MASSVRLGGSAWGCAADGLLDVGTYSGGSAYTNFTVAGSVTTVGSQIR